MIRVRPRRTGLLRRMDNWREGRQTFKKLCAAWQPVTCHLLLTHTTPETATAGEEKAILLLTDKTTDTRVCLYCFGP